MMKKIITLCVFAFALLFSTQGIEAQNKLEINAAASEKAKDIRKTIKINNDQLEEVYQAYKEFELAYSKISGNIEANQERLEKINNLLDEKLKAVMTEEQFEKYLQIYRTY
jgi:predicted  nucleic acid-binding Zn-ribbon protein